MVVSISGGLVIILQYYKCKKISLFQGLEVYELSFDNMPSVPAYLTHTLTLYNIAVP